MVMDSHCIDAGRHGFGGDHSKLFSVRTVFVKFVDHFLGDDFGARSSQFTEILSVWIKRINGSILTAGVAEQDDVVVGIALF